MKREEILRKLMEHGRIYDTNHWTLGVPLTLARVRDRLKCNLYSHCVVELETVLKIFEKP